MLGEGGGHMAAAELMEQSLELAPQWAAGWYQLATYAGKAGLEQKAVHAPNETLQLLEKSGRPDIFGAGLMLASLQGRAPECPSSSYAEGLFDDYAERFEQSLVEKLHYAMPGELANLIMDHAGPSHRFRRVVDLGCGTGLFGARIAAHADCLEGFDLSRRMLSKAAAKKIYHHLARADLTLPPGQSGLFGERGRADLVAAAALMIDLGDLRMAVATAAALMAPDGMFAFSIETASQASGFELRPSLRYAHSRSHVAAVLAGAGLEIVAAQETVIRMDAGQPVCGLLFLARFARTLPKATLQRDGRRANHLPISAEQA